MNNPLLSGCLKFTQLPIKAWHNTDTYFKFCYAYYALGRCNKHTELNLTFHKLTLERQKVKQKAHCNYTHHFRYCKLSLKAAPIKKFKN